MTNLFTYFSKKSLSPDNGPIMARHWPDNGPAFFRHLLTLLFCLFSIGISTAWGATKTFTPTNFNTQGNSNGGNISYENSPITVSSSKGYGYSTGQTRIFSGGTLVVSCTSGYTISGVALTFTSPNYQGGLSTSYTGLSTTSWTSPTLTGTARISGITVTYAANPTHTLSSAVSPAATGSVSLSATSVSEGGTATATATPNSGYRFSSWSISGTGASLSSTSSNPTTVTMGTANATVTATFVAKDCTDKGTSSITSTSGGNSCDYGPVDSYYKYSTRQILYKKSELDLSSGKKGMIKSIYFKYKYTSAMTKKTNVNIYMANTNLNSLSTSSYVPYSEFTLVYSGSLNCTTTNNWNEFFLDTPFEYNGTGNLVVLIDDNSNAYDGNSYTFYYHSATGAQIYRRSDSDNQNPSTADWTTYSVQNYRPSTKFCIEEIGSCGADPSVGSASLNGSVLWTYPLRVSPPLCRAA